MFALIAAVGQNRELGNRGQLIFHLKDDMRFFKATTSGHPVIMGRKTWESLPKKLPNRLNLVVSHSPQSIPLKYPTSAPNPLKTPQNALKAQIPPENSSNLLQNTSIPPENSPKSPQNLANSTTSTPVNPNSPDQIITDFPAFLEEHASDPETYFIIGGASVYEQALPYADTLFLTEIAASAPADTFFPPFDPNNYTKTLIKKGSENGLDFANKINN